MLVSIWLLPPPLLLDGILLLIGSLSKWCLMLRQLLAGTYSFAVTLLPSGTCSPVQNSNWRTKMLTLIYTDVHSIWQSHSKTYHASTLKWWEQDKHRQLAATISYISAYSEPQALVRDRDDSYIPDFMSKLPTYTSTYMNSWIRQYEPAIRAPSVLSLFPFTP